MTPHRGAGSKPSDWQSGGFVLFRLGSFLFSSTFAFGHPMPVAWAREEYWLVRPGEAGRSRLLLCRGRIGQTTVATNLAIIRATEERDVLLIAAADQETASDLHRAPPRAPG